MSILFHVREPFYPIRGSLSFRINNLLKNFNDSAKVFLVPKNQSSSAIQGVYPNSYVYKASIPISRFSYTHKYLQVTLFALESLCLIKKAVNLHGVKVIYSFGSAIGMILRFIPKGIPLVLDVCETDLPYVKSSSESIPMRSLGLTMESLIFRELADINGKIFVLTDAIKKYLTEMWGVKSIEVAYDGTDPALFKPISYNAKRRHPAIVFIGDIGSRDGVDVLITCFPSIMKECKEIKLYVIGDGPMRDKLEKMAFKMNLGRNIVFTGWLPFSKLVKILPHFLVGVVPSKRMLINDLVIPRKVFEFLAAGVPVVASNLSAIKEVIKDSENGLLFNPDDDQELAEAILKVISDEGLYQKLQSNGRRTSLKYNVHDEVHKIARSIAHYLNRR
jgi:glycosyltransferase involved in cell wall biosynthesis